MIPAGPIRRSKTASLTWRVTPVTSPADPAGRLLIWAVGSSRLTVIRAPRSGTVGPKNPGGAVIWIVRRAMFCSAW